MEKRRSLPAGQKRLVRERQNHLCAKCKAPLGDGRVEFNHRLALIFGGDNSLDNFEALHPKCHRVDTNTVIKGRRKAIRIAKKHTGTYKKSKAKFKGRSSFDQWLGMDGTKRTKK